MESTPISVQLSSDSGCITSSFEASNSLYNSTPNGGIESTPVSFTASRKRKVSYCNNVCVRKLTEVLESCPSTPQFCSTMNESLLENLEKCHIESNVCDESIAVSQPTKFFKTCTDPRKYRSAPNTPEKQVTLRDEYIRKPNSFIKTLSSSVNSPLKEAHDILYPNIKPCKPARKPLTPQKFKQNLNKFISPAKKRLFTPSRRELFVKIVQNTLIMDNIFKNLSNGDLYRLSMVSKLLQNAVYANPTALNRYLTFKGLYKTNKENYKITPPGSPEQEKDLSPPSPGSRKFRYFCDYARSLNSNQSLNKCPMCSKASIVENNVGQCQGISCGYIYCLLCGSGAIDPSMFEDKCRTSQLPAKRTRPTLGDLSNSSADFTELPSFLSSTLNTSSKLDSSGFFSESETSPSVKRNLSMSFSSMGEKPRVLSNNNNRVVKPQQKIERRNSLVPVIPVEPSKRKPIDILEPSSPPKVKSYAACSKQSKRNLKRLTR